MTRPCKCGECAFFKNEDANGYGHCIITLNQYRCDDLCKFKRIICRTWKPYEHYIITKNGGAAGTGGRRIPLSSVRR